MMEGLQSKPVGDRRCPLICGMLKNNQIRAYIVVAALLCVRTSAVFVANMSGEGVEGYPAPVPDTYTGSAVLTFEDLPNRLARIDYLFTQSGLDQILNVWLLTPTDNINGEVILDFTPSVDLEAYYVNGSVSGSFMTTQDIALGVQQRPGMFYISVKTNAYASGAIRGQIYDTSTTVTTGLIPNAVIDVNMTAEEVVGMLGPEYGFGMGLFAIFYLGNGSVYMEYDFTDLNITDITSVGFYAGAAGATGELQIDLSPAIDLLAFSYNGFSSGAIIILNEVAFRILNDVSIVYCQITTTDYPTGAIRGQLNVVQLSLTSPPPPGTQEALAPIIYAPGSPSSPPPAAGNSGSLSSQRHYYLLAAMFSSSCLLMKIIQSLTCLK